MKAHEVRLKVDNAVQAQTEVEESDPGPHFWSD